MNDAHRHEESESGQRDVKGGHDRGDQASREHDRPPAASIDRLADEGPREKHADREDADHQPHIDRTAPQIADVQRQRGQQHAH